MLESAPVVALLSECLEELADQSDFQVPKPITESTPLMGKSSGLDSLGLVNLIVDVEGRLLDDFDVEVTLADERAMSQKHSPFRTIGSLAEYICMLDREPHDGD